MKFLFLGLVLVLGLQVKMANAQTVVITDDAAYTTGQASSVLDVKSISKGFLAPRVTAAQRIAISSPDDGLWVYQTDASKGFYFYNSTLGSWIPLGTVTGWSISGNSGTTNPTNFLGTTDKISLGFRTNNIQRLFIDTSGSIGIGSTSFDATNREKLLVDAGTSTSVTGLHVTGGLNNYFQLNIRNSSSGNSASSDVVATADNGTQTTNYVDLGINSSTYTLNSTGGPNDGYLLSQGNNFLIENLNPAKDILFATGSGTKEIMRLTGTGHTGIGINNPLTPLAVKDTIEIKRVGSLAYLEFSNTAGSGDFKIGGDGGDIFWQGGGGRFLQMGSYWSTIIGGDRQIGTPLAFSSGFTNNVGTIIAAQRDPSVALAVIAHSGTQSANLQQWLNSGGTVLSMVDNVGNLALGTNSSSSNRLLVSGTTQLTGNTTVTGNTVLGGTVKVGTNGSTLNTIIKASFSITNNTSFSNSTNISSVIAVTNVTVGAVVSVSPSAALPNALFVAHAFVSSAGNITVVIGNTGSNTALGTASFNAVIIQ